MHQQIGSATTKQVLQVTYPGHHRVHSFDQNALAACLMSVVLEVEWVFDQFLETDINEGDGCAFKAVNKLAKVLVMSVGGILVQRNDLPSLVDQPTQLHPQNPATVRLAFLAQWRGAVPFAYRMQQLNDIAVDDDEKRRFCHYLFTPSRKVAQVAPQTCSLWQPSAKQACVVAPQPELERPEIPAFERKQQSGRHLFARIQDRLRMVVHYAHSVIYQTKHMKDKVFGSNGSGACVSFDTPSMPDVHDFFQLAPLIN